MSKVKRVDLHFSFDAIILMGPPGSGKSFLGRHLSRHAIASYVELEPVLRQTFGTGEVFRARIHEVGAFLMRSYREQLSRATLPVAFESTGVSDRIILEQLMRDHRVAVARVRADRSVCMDRVVSRPIGTNISETTDRDLGRRLRYCDAGDAGQRPSGPVRGGVSGRVRPRPLVGATIALVGPSGVSR
jgi:hypothetical protein